MWTLSIYTFYILITLTFTHTFSILHTHFSTNSASCGSGPEGKGERSDGRVDHIKKAMLLQGRKGHLHKGQSSSGPVMLQHVSWTGVLATEPEVFAE